MIDWGLNKDMIFFVLFIFLFYWVLKKNDEREKRYINTIETLGKQLGIVEDIKLAIDRMEEYFIKEGF